MFIVEMFEGAQRPVVVTYPGRFQPFHLGHADVFHSLQAKFGNENVYIVTSNKTNSDDSPFNYSDKLRFMHAAGIPDHNIIESNQPYKVPDQFEARKADIIFITAVGSPDATRLRPGSIKKDGNPSYYQKLPENLSECKTADEHGYVVIADERSKTINIDGQACNVSHGTACRQLWNDIRDEPAKRAEFVKQLYGRADPELAQILDKISDGSEPPAPKPSPKLKKVKVPTAMEEGWFDSAKEVATWYLKKDGDVIRTVNGEPFTFKSKEDAVNWAMRNYKISYEKQRIMPTTNPDKNLITNMPGKLGSIAKEGEVLTKDDLVDIYISGRDKRYNPIQRKVASNIPNSLVDAYIDKVAKKFKLNPRSFVYGPAKITEGLNEFARDDDDHGSGRWYTDDQMADIIGDDWNDFEVGQEQGHADRLTPQAKEFLVSEAQIWLDDHGYNVIVSDVKDNHAHGYLDWYIEGNFRNSNFAKNELDEGVAEGESRGGIDLEVTELPDEDQILITATSHGKTLGRVYFDIFDSQLVAADAEVASEYRGQGIAAIIYDYAKELGWEVVRSGRQTDAGAGFWDKHRPKQDVWEQGVAEGFNSKQEVIAHFVRQGKSAASGAAAWERGWRGSQPKKKKLQPPVRSYHDDLDDKRYGTDVDEAYEPKYWHQNPEAVKKAHDWRETETGTDVRMYQGYKMKFTPDALLIYKGGDLVDKRPGNFSNPTNGNIVTGKRLIGMHIQKQKQSQPIDEDAAGVGVVKGGKDPRYMTATMGDDNDVTPDTLNQMMRGYNLVAKKPAARHQKTVKSTVGKGMNEDLPPPEAARKTQIKGTLPTYLKARDVLDKSGVEGPALDFGAGAGHGTEHLGPDAKSYEPFPQGNFTPHYVDVSKIPSNAFKKIVNLNVLNVVPNVEGNRIRDSIVQNIGRVLAPGGIAIITTRGKDVLTIKGQAGPEPTSMISSIGTYQKGFTSKELLGYIQGVLGSGFEVATLKLGPAGVTIRKLQASVDESEHDFSPMSWSARELGRKPTPHRMDMQPHERDDHDFRREMDSIKHEFAKLYGEPEATKYNVAEDAGGTGAGAMATSMGGGNGFGWSVFYKGLQQRRKKVNK